MFRKKDNSSSGGGEWAGDEPAGPTVGAVHDPSKDAGFKGQLSSQRRRIGERLRQGRGAGDADFSERAQRVFELRDKVEKVKKAIKHQLDACRTLCASCAELENSVSDADVRDVEFQNMMHDLDERARKTMEDDVSAALASLERKLAPFEDLQKRVKTRDALKLDYDHYVRKVKDLKEKPGADSSKLTGNESKLEAAKQRVAEATVSIVKAFNYYEAIGGRMVQPELEMLKKAQLAFFEAAYTTVRNVSVKDPRAVAAEIERLGREGMERPAGYDFDGSTSGGIGSSSAGSSNYNSNSYDSYGRSPPGSTPSSPGVSGRSAFAPDPSNGGNRAAPAVTAAWMTNAGGGGGSGGGGQWWDKAGADSGAGGGGGGGFQPFGGVPAAAAPGNPFGGGGARPPPPPPAANHERAKALYSYAPQDNTEIALTAGDVITILEKHGSGWWTGEKNGQRGLFPSNYVQII